MSTPETFTLAQLDRTVTNLETLADYIHQHVSQEQIDMDTYASDDRESFELLEAYQSNNRSVPCGTSACALGHAVMCFADYYHAQHGEKLPEDAPDYEEFGLDLFPAVTDRCYQWIEGHGRLTTRWERTFGAHLSSKKTEVVQRLRDMAKEVRTLPAENIPDTRS